jgi:mono/diheme cytochrome c family protein/uncharacterized membrane protein
MASRDSLIHSCRFAMVLLVVNLIAVQLTRPATAQTQAGSAESRAGKTSPPSTTAESASPIIRELYRQHCVECHAADGTGRPVRRSMPGIPDFTNAHWLAQRTDERLRASIVDGKGEDMPPAPEEISVDQTRGLVAYVRAFARVTPSSDRVEPQEFASTSDEEGGPRRSFFAKLIPWLGKFHPPAVHFPIALFVAAAVAELLGLLIGKRDFEAVSRFCVRFGSVTGVGAGVLGWFAGGLHLTDSSAVMMAHRWLGTGTIACALILLVLAEASRSPERRRTRNCFRATLLVVALAVMATGFLGGAIAFGLDHYRWPA